MRFGLVEYCITAVSSFWIGVDVGLADIIEKSVLSRWQTVLMPPGVSRANSGHVSPSLG